MLAFLNFLQTKQSYLFEMLLQHIEMVGISLAISIVIGVAVGVFISFHPKIVRPVLYVASVFLTIPCFALFAFLLPILGLNRAPVYVGLVIYTLLPIIRNVYVGLHEVDQSLLDNARGLGMKPWEVLIKVQVPIAMPMIIAGIRTAIALGIGVGAIAAYIGAGGLGTYIFQGISRGNINMVLAASLLLALLTIVIDIALRFAQKACLKRTV